MDAIPIQPELATPGGIAVIGLAGRFPGADSAEQFWENLVAGVSGVTDVRVGTRRSCLPSHPNYVPKSAVIKNGDWFDAKFFGIYPKQAIDLDAQHRLFLEVCWHAMENAGYIPDEAPGRVGVFAGCHMNMYIFTRMAADTEFREADGLTKVYHELSDHLGEVQTVYGLNSPGVRGLPIPDSLEELAADMIREMREIQPHGPYLLAGYCSGGTTAMEIGRQLIEDGEQVAMLAMIETYNRLTAPSTNPSFLTQLSYGRQRVEFQLRNFFQLGWNDKKEFLTSKWDAAHRRMKVWKGSVVSMFSKRKTKKPAALVNMADIWLKHDQIAEKYIPRVYPGRIIHFRPSRDYKCHLGTEVECNEVEYHRMRAYPAGMMVNPFVAELATAIRREMDRGLSEVSVSCADREISPLRSSFEAVGV